MTAPISLADERCKGRTVKLVTTYTRDPFTGVYEATTSEHVPMRCDAAPIDQECLRCDEGLEGYCEQHSPIYCEECLDKATQDLADAH